MFDYRMVHHVVSGNVQQREIANRILAFVGYHNIDDAVNAFDSNAGLLELALPGVQGTLMLIDQHTGEVVYQLPFGYGK